MSTTEIDLTPLREAVERVRKETGDDFVTALVHFGGIDGSDKAQFGIYVEGGTHWSDSFDSAADKAIAARNNTNEHKLAKAAEYRQKADALEREAKA